MRMIERRPPGRKFMPCCRFLCSAAPISACERMSPALMGTFLSLSHGGIVPDADSSTAGRNDAPVPDTQQERVELDRRSGRRVVEAGRMRDLTASGVRCSD